MFTFATPFFYIGLGSGIRDPGSGMNKYSDPDPGSRIKHPGSATLFGSITIFVLDLKLFFLFGSGSEYSYVLDPDPTFKKLRNPFWILARIFTFSSSS
jgi:hypothetical protein